MKTELKEIKSTIRELTITVPKDKALNDYQKTLQNFKKYVQIPGFRKGKAPLHMVERNYGEYAKEEFFNQKIEDYYKEALDKGDFHPVNAGEMKKVEWDKGSDLVAVFEFEVMPEIKVEKYKNLEIPFEEREYSENMVDEVLKDYQKNMGVLKEIEVVDENCKVIMDVNFIDENKEVTKTVSRTIKTGSENVYGERFNQEILGKKKDESFETVLFDKPQENPDKDFGENIIGRTFLISVKKIEKEELPEIDDDFAKDLEYESLDDMKQKVIQELKEKIDKENKDRLRGAILESLIKENPFELPQSIVQNYAQNMAEPYAKAYKMDVEKLIPMYSSIAEYNLKSFYLIQEIIKSENIELTDEEKETHIKEAAKKMNDMDIEKYKKLYKKQIESDDFYFETKETKVIEFIQNTATFVPYPKEDKKVEEKLDKPTDSE